MKERTALNIEALQVLHSQVRLAVCQGQLLKSSVPCLAFALLPSLTMDR